MRIKILIRLQHKGGPQVVISRAGLDGIPLGVTQG